MNHRPDRRSPSWTPCSLHNQVVRTSTTDDKIPALIEEISAFHSSGSQWLVVPTGDLRALETHLPDHGYRPELEGDAYSVDTASTWSEGEVEATGNINRYDALGFGFLWVGATVPEYRERGAYRALLGARCRWARARGMERVGLYANRETSASVVAGLGFSKHGPMAYWKR